MSESSRGVCKAACQSPSLQQIARPRFARWPNSSLQGQGRIQPVPNPRQTWRIPRAVFGQSLLLSEVVWIHLRQKSFGVWPVAMNIKVAASERSDRRDNPHTPCPLVHLEPGTNAARQLHCDTEAHVVCFSKPPSMPLMPAMRPRKTTIKAAAKPMSTPPARADHGTVLMAGAAVALSGGTRQ